MRGVNHVIEAVKQLRLSIQGDNGKSLSQTEFGRLIGKSLNTVQRYETLVPPKGRTLFVLAELAKKHSLPHLNLLFKEAGVAEMNVGHGLCIEISGPEEAAVLRVFQEMIRNPKWHAVRTQALNLMAPIRTASENSQH